MKSEKARRGHQHTKRLVLVDYGDLMELTAGGPHCVHPGFDSEAWVPASEVLVVSSAAPLSSSIAVGPEPAFPTDRSVDSARDDSGRC